MTESPVDKVVDEAAEPAGDAVAQRPSLRRAHRVVLAGWVAAAVVLAGLVGLNVALYLSNSTGRAVESARSAAVASANKRIPEMLSYSYKTLDHDIAQAVTNITGPFKSDYEALLKTAVAPTAADKKITTKAEVVGASVVIARRESAVLLVFVDQTTTSSLTKTPQIDGSRIRVAMKKIGGDWLISSLSPV